MSLSFFRYIIIVNYVQKEVKPLVHLFWNNKNKDNKINPADYDSYVDDGELNNKISPGLYNYLSNQESYPSVNSLDSGVDNDDTSVEKSINKKGKAVGLNSADPGFLNDYSTIGGELNNPSEILAQKKQLTIYSKDSLVQAIIRTRINQVLVYARPARYSRTGKGFKIIPKDSINDRKSQRKQSSQVNNTIARLENSIETLGDDSDFSYSRKSFPNFLASIIHDKYVYDQINVERVFDKNGNINHYNNVDASTILIKSRPKSVDTPREFCQYSSSLMGKPIATFSEKELTFYTTNNYGSIYRNGYGYSEVEAALSHLLYHQDTEQFNARFFSQGGTTRGILLIDPGDNSSQQNTMALASLRRMWQANFSGNNGAWKTPVMTGRDAKYINMTQSSKDMEFEHWLNYLINIVTSVFQIQPDEINFPNKGGSSGMHAGNSVNEGSTSKSKMKQSHDKGLEPLMQTLEDFITNEILKYLPDGDKYVFRFTLGDSEDAEREQDIIQKKLANGATLGEAREAMGLPALDTDKLPDSMKFINSMPGTPATIVQFMQYIYSQDQSAQFTTQHKNDIDPSKADHGQPEKGMPVDAVKEKLNTDNKPIGSQDKEDPDDLDN